MALSYSSMFGLLAWCENHNERYSNMDAAIATTNSQRPTPVSRYAVERSRVTPQDRLGGILSLGGAKDSLANKAIERLR